MTSLSAFASLSTADAERSARALAQRLSSLASLARQALASASEQADARAREATEAAERVGARLLGLPRASRLCPADWIELDILCAGSLGFLRLATSERISCDLAQSRLAQPLAPMALPDALLASRLALDQERSARELMSECQARLSPYALDVLGPQPAPLARLDALRLAHRDFDALSPMARAARALQAPRLARGAKALRRARAQGVDVFELAERSIAAELRWRQAQARLNDLTHERERRGAIEAGRQRDREAIERFERWSLPRSASTPELSLGLAADAGFDWCAGLERLALSRPDLSRELRALARLAFERLALGALASLLAREIESILPGVERSEAFGAAAAERARRRGHGAHARLPFDPAQALRSAQERSERIRQLASRLPSAEFLRPSKSPFEPGSLAIDPAAIHRARAAFGPASALLRSNAPDPRGWEAALWTQALANPQGLAPLLDLAPPPWEAPGFGSVLAWDN